MIILMPHHTLPETGAVTTRTERVPLTKKFEGSSAQVELQELSPLFSALEFLTAGANDSDPLTCELAGLAWRLLQAADYARRPSANQTGSRPASLPQK
ncbi:hypothetical protein PtB15_4B670 [Puccinia triticina]|nr:hypothetical protein PtB15_4B670 [Puccinia triticina]